MQLTPGTIVGEKYLLLKPLLRPGKRRMQDRGAVWFARHRQLGTPCAVKVFTAEDASSLALGARFTADVRVAQTLATQHVARVHDHGDENGIQYVAMELLSGEDLATRLLGRRRLSLHEAGRIAAHVGAALRCAH